MILWIIAFVLLGLMAWVGYQQGAVRSTVAFIGLIIAALLAMPLSKFIYPVLGIFDLKHPLAKQAVAPLVIFIVIWAVFQFVAQKVYQKVEIHYKYNNRNDKLRMKFERLDAHAGIFMGLMNGAVYFLLLMVPIYVFGYLTVQIASGAEDPAGVRIMTSMRQQIESTKLDKVLAAWDPAKPEVYDAFDIVGLVYKNPLLESRLARYPGFLSLTERKEFQDLATDLDFHNSWQSNAKVGDLLKHPKVQALLSNHGLVTEIQSKLVPDLKDLRTFLETGVSEKYDEKILGHWKFNFAETKNRSRNPSTDQRRVTAALTPYWDAIFIATPENTAMIKRGPNVPVPQGQTPSPYITQGTWQKESGLYEVTLDGKKFELSFDREDRLTIVRDSLPLVFDKEL